MSLLTWIYSKKDELGIEFSTDDWPKKSGLHLYDYETSIQYKNNYFVGRGVDESEPVAIIKSASEVIERLICDEFNVSSVGLSIQSEDKSFDSELHAKNEVLERFYLKRHIDLNTPFKILEASSHLCLAFAKHNDSCKVTFFKMETPLGYYGTGCLLENGNRVSTGFSFSNNEAQSAEKAFIEALPNYFWLQENEMTENAKPWHIQAAFISKIKELIASDNMVHSKIASSLVLPKIEFINLDLSKHELLATAPIQVKSFRIKNEN